MADSGGRVPTVEFPEAAIHAAVVQASLLSTHLSDPANGPMDPEEYETIVCRAFFSALPAEWLLAKALDEGKIACLLAGHHWHDHQPNPDCVACQGRELLRSAAALLAGQEPGG